MHTHVCRFAFAEPAAHNKWRHIALLSSLSVLKTYTTSRKKKKQSTECTRIFECKTKINEKQNNKIVHAIRAFHSVCVCMWFLPCNKRNGLFFFCVVLPSFVCLFSCFVTMFFICWVETRFGKWVFCARTKNHFTQIPLFVPRVLDLFVLFLEKFTLNHIQWIWKLFWMFITMAHYNRCMI